MKKSKQEYDRNFQLKRRYGITIEDYDYMLKEQGHRCAICRTDNPGGQGRFHVDHCHDTGRVRGLLCSNCNHGLGKFQDSVLFLEQAIRYLNEKEGD